MATSLSQAPLLALRMPCLLCTTSKGLGLRVPFVDLKLSQLHGLPQGQPSLPSNIVLDSDAWYVWAIHLMFRLTLPFSATTWLFRLKQLAVPPRFIKDYPDLVEIGIKNIIHAQEHFGYLGTMQCLAHETILDWGRFDLGETPESCSVVCHG